MFLGLSRSFWIMLVAIVAVTAVAITGPRLHRIALLGSGFMAQTLCAGVFVSKRDAASIRAEELSGPRYALLRFFEPTIDRAQKTVSASLHGFAPRTSVYRDGLGCTLAAGKTPEQLRAVSANLFPPLPPVDSEALWPKGEKVDLTLPEGINREAIDEAIANIFAEPDPARPRRTRALVVVHQGRIVVERYAPGFDAEMPLVGWSMSKTATEALVGLRVKDGKLHVSQDALMPEWRGADDPRGRITLDELMRMTSGLAFDEDYDDDLSDVTQMLFVQGDVAAFAADKPLAHKPGTYWYYSSGSTNIISGVLKQTFTQMRDYLRFPRERLFGPLGMRSAVLEPDASGTFIAASALYASARDWARLGLFFLQDGMWEGKRLLPQGWLAYILRPTPQAPDGRYGAQVWLKLTESENFGEPPMPEDAYYMLGHDQQVVAVVPSRDLVVVRLGLTRAVGDWDTARELGPLVNAFPARAP
jgi:CubicO group peptidase (beta-lactamase class C family)